MKIRIVATTDVGKERTNNEDAYIICPDLSQQDWALNETPSYVSLNKYGSVIVVADGMGGANAGEIASTIATNSVRKTLSKENIKEFVDTGNLRGLLELCIKNADEAINKFVWDNPDTAGMGTTIVLCWIINQMAYVAWCGDSRCYVFNPYAGLKLLTKDHSLVQELIDRNEISEKEAFTHPDNNIITRYLGDVDSQSILDITIHSLCSNDLILLCSDGLCGYCTNRQIEKIIESNYIDVMKCRDELLNMALDTGGHDNICIALASIISDEQNVPLTLSIWQKFINCLKRCFHARRVE